MEEQLISFETAKLAYKKGYTRETVGISFTSTRRNYYNKEGELNGDCTDFIKDVIKHGRDTARINHIIYPATSQSLLQKWLREIHNIDVLPDLDDENTSNKYSPIIYLKKIIYSDCTGKLFTSYEEALEKGLQEALKLI